MFMDQQNNRGKRYTRTEHVVASTFDVSYNKQGHHARELKCVQMPKREIRVGQWKQLYPPEDHGKTTSLPVVGDHSILQNIKLLHYKYMETMSQGPRAVTSSQRRLISP